LIDRCDKTNLLTLIASHQQLGFNELKREEIIDWSNRLQKLIQSQLDTEENPNILCHLTELFAFLLLQKKILNIESIDIDRIITELGKIPSMVDSAPLYPVSHLATRIEEVAKMYLIMDSESEEGKALDSFLEEIEDIAEIREEGFDRAKRYIRKGAKLIRPDGSVSSYKALDYFHQATSLYLHDESIEGYVLGLINIAQLYSTRTMNLAAKQQCLSGMITCLQHGENKLLKRIADSAATMLLIDFQQGAWITAFHDFLLFSQWRTELDSSPLNIEKDDILRKSIGKIAIALHLAPQISPQLSAFISCVTGTVSDHFRPSLDEALSTLSEGFEQTSIPAFLRSNLSDVVLGDIGPRRTICWKNCNVEWKLVFDNDYMTNSCAEEFCAAIQILLTEIELRNPDIPFTANHLEIELIAGTSSTSPEEIVSGESSKWTITAPIIEKPTDEEALLHQNFLFDSIRIILSSVCKLPSSEFDEIYQTVIKKRDLIFPSPKNAYQVMFRLIYSEDSFNQYMRSQFNPIS
jgi:hypothetical protein